MGSEKTDPSSGSSSGSDAGVVVTLDDEARDEIVRTKVTCPFLGSAVHEGLLAVRGDAGNPLASIADVRDLGNSGGGDFGDVLALFATGNHAFMRGDSGKLDKKAPSGLFSLELPGSQGSHPGHSGILQGDPNVLGSGRVSEKDFERLAKRATNGFLKRSDVGRFIAENLARDPKSKVFGMDAVKKLSADIGELGKAVVDAALAIFREPEDEHRTLKEKLTKLTGEDNLVGSAGEFALLFTLLAHKPGAGEIDGEPAISLQDVRAMFLEKRLPAGWRDWKKLRADWVKHSAALLLSAGKEYHALKR
jgi:hypothetical protein